MEVVKKLNDTIILQAACDKLGFSSVVSKQV